MSKLLIIFYPIYIICSSLSELLQKSIIAHLLLSELLSFLKFVEHFIYVTPLKMF